MQINYEFRTLNYENRSLFISHGFKYNFISCNGTYQNQINFNMFDAPWNRRNYCSANRYSQLKSIISIIWSSKIAWKCWIRLIAFFDTHLNYKSTEIYSNRLLSLSMFYARNWFGNEIDSIKFYDYFYVHSDALFSLDQISVSVWIFHELKWNKSIATTYIFDNDWRHNDKESKSQRARQLKFINKKSKHMVHIK